jgi:hypothetical protein
MQNLCQEMQPGTEHIAYNVFYLKFGGHPVAVVQYTFTHKQYKEQHSDTEYTEYHIHDNKNI